MVLPSASVATIARLLGLNTNSFNFVDPVWTALQSCEYVVISDEAWRGFDISVLLANQTTSTIARSGMNALRKRRLTSVRSGYRKRFCYRVRFTSR